jgi:hypothetical protein
VKTFKRDYVRVNPRPDAISVLQQLSAWFADYNAVHPHSGLRMLSPREFIAQQSANPVGCPLWMAPALQVRFEGLTCWSGAVFRSAC